MPLARAVGAPRAEGAALEQSGGAERAAAARHELHHAADRVRAVDRALRSPDDLDPIQIEQRQVGGVVAAAHVVQADAVDHDQREIALAAAGEDRRHGAAAAAAGHGESGHRSQGILRAFELPRAQFRLVEDGQRGAAGRSRERDEAGRHDDLLAHGGEAHRDVGRGLGFVAQGDATCRRVEAIGDDAQGVLTLGRFQHERAGGRRMGRRDGAGGPVEDDGGVDDRGCGTAGDRADEARREGGRRQQGQQHPGHATGRACESFDLLGVSTRRRCGAECANRQRTCPMEGFLTWRDYERLLAFPQPWGAAVAFDGPCGPSSDETGSPHHSGGTVWAFHPASLRQHRVVGARIARGPSRDGPAGRHDAGRRPAAEAGHFTPSVAAPRPIGITFPFRASGGAVAARTLQLSTRSA